jgi:hypothetical protein
LASNVILNVELSDSKSASEKAVELGVLARSQVQSTLAIEDAKEKKRRKKKLEETLMPESQVVRSRKTSQEVSEGLGIIDNFNDGNLEDYIF